MLIAAFPLLLLLAQDVRSAAPKSLEPSPRPVSWEISLRFLEPRRIEVQLPGESKPETYWYLVYTAINTSSTTQDFFPIFQLATDDLHLFETDMGLNRLVFDAIKERHRLTHPRLVDPTHAIGPLPVGDDNARESVAIWRNVDLGGSNHFKIFAAGLSGETRLVRNPGYHSPPGGAASQPAATANNGRYFTLRKTLEISYNLPGSEETREQAEPQRMSVRWIMR